jgi:hypothetical protein
MSLWSVAAALGFGGMLVVTAAVQPRSWRWHRRVEAHDPCGYVPAWTFFAPHPGVKDARLLWREQLVDGSIGPWHELAPPYGGLLRAVWSPAKRARKAVWDCGYKVARAGVGDPGGLDMLTLPYLMIVQYVTGLPASPLGAARQFVVVDTQGADNQDGPFELRFASAWHRLPGATPASRVEPSQLTELAQPAA